MQAVSATPGSRIVERNLKIVVSQEPTKSGPSSFTPAPLPCGAISLQARRDDRAGLHRLLVEAGLLGRHGIEALRSDRHEMALHLTTLNRDQPIQSFEPRRNHLFVPGAHSRSNQSLRQSRIAVCQPILKPLPVIGTVA